MNGIIIDNFAGGGGASTGIEAALGRQIDYAINHDPRAIAVHRANHPQTYHYCEDVWEVDPREVAAGRRVSVAWFSPDCFPAGTMVLTDRGYLPIESIRFNDRVLTHKNRWRRVTAIHATQKPIIEIYGHGHPGLQVTAEHPFYTRQRNDVWNNNTRQYRGILGMPEWNKSSILDQGWYWATPIKVEPLKIPILRWKHKGATNIPTDERLMWLAGRYVGDGWTRINKKRAELVIICGYHEADEAGELLNKWPRTGERVKDGELAWNRRDLKTAVQFSTNSRALVTWLRNNFGHGAKNKRLPAWAYGMSNTFRKALLEGYLSADGWSGQDCRGHGLLEVSTVSRSLAFSVKTLVVTMGYAPSVYYSHRKQSIIECRKVKSSPIYRVRWRSRKPGRHAQTFASEKHRWAPIRGKTLTSKKPVWVYNIGVEEDESYVADGIVVHNCTHHSRARGGKPVDKNIRGLAWVATRYAATVQPDLIFLENVEEFKEWGPLKQDEITGEWYADKEKHGQTFQRWIKEFYKLGYTVDYRSLTACDYGAPTSRTRLFLVARRDGRPIVWPEPTHGTEEVPYRTAAECIDWSIPCPSIFSRKKPLVENTMRRIARGLERFVINAADPFILVTSHAGQGDARRVYPLDRPLTTVVSKAEHYLVSPYIVKHYGGATGSEIDTPFPTITARGTQNQLLTAFLSRHFGEGVGRPVDNPAPTITPGGGGKTSLITAFMTRYFGRSIGCEVESPAPTIESKNKTGIVTSHLIKMRGTCRHGQDMREPMPTVTAGGNHLGEVRAFLVKYYGTATGQALNEPAHTITPKSRLGLVTVAGEDYQIIDIGMRMLQPRELYLAQGFPPGYIIDPIYNGKPLIKTAQVWLVGNSVSPHPAEALVRANL